MRLQMRTMCNLHNVLTYQLPYEQLNDLSSTPTSHLIIHSKSQETSRLILLIMFQYIICLGLSASHDRIYGIAFFLPLLYISVGLPTG